MKNRTLMRVGNFLSPRSRARISDSVLFEAHWYSAEYLSGPGDYSTALEHYMSFGRSDGCSPHPLFDPNWYQEQIGKRLSNPLFDFLKRGSAALHSPCVGFDSEHYVGQLTDENLGELTPLEHYLTLGWKRAYDPHPFFDVDWYLEQNEDVAEAGAEPLTHFVVHGWREGRAPHPLVDLKFLEVQLEGVEQYKNPFFTYLAQSHVGSLSPHPLFDPSWYRRTYAIETDPFGHYCSIGYRDNRPFPLFDTCWYRSQNSLESHVNPLVHVGTTDSSALNAHPLFDAAWYEQEYVGRDHRLPAIADYYWNRETVRRGPNPSFLGNWYHQQNPGLREAGLTALQHYEEVGRFEAAEPNPVFDSRWYASHYLGGEGSRSESYFHYVASPPGEQKPCLLFDPQWYKRANPDVDKANVDPLRHFLLHGLSEQRQPSPWFDAEWYARSVDPKESGTTSLLHFNQLGIFEGRDPHPLVDLDWLLETARKEDCHTFDQALHWFIEEADQWQVAASPKYAPDWLAKLSIAKQANYATPFHVFAEHSFCANTRSAIFRFGCVEPTSLSQLIEDELTVSQADLPVAVSEEIRNFTTTQNVLVSVIMPTWNRRKVIGRAIDSVLAQTYPEYELLVVDDGSDDDTVSYLKRTYAEHLDSGRIKLLLGQHGGVSAARNIGLANARGEIIGYLDSDNAWLPRTLELYVWSLLINPSVASTYCPIRSVRVGSDETPKVIGRSFDRRALLSSNFIDLNGFAHQRTLYDQLGGFCEFLRRLVDWELIIRFTRDRGARYLPIVSVDYYLDKPGLSNITFTESLKDNFEAVVDLHRREFMAYSLISSKKALTRWLDTSSFNSNLIEQRNAYVKEFEQRSALSLAIVFDHDEIVDVSDLAAWLECGFGAQVYTKKGELLYPVLAPSKACAPSEIEESILYWPTSVVDMLSPNSLFQCLLSFGLESLDVAVVSYGEFDSPSLAMRRPRDHILVARRVAHAYLHDQSLPYPIKGKQLRLETHRVDSCQVHDRLGDFLRHQVEVDKRSGLFWSKGSRVAEFSLSQFELSSLEVPLDPSKPTVLVVPMKTAVGGVEHLTLTLVRELRSRYNFVCLALERPGTGQKNMSRDFADLCDSLIEGEVASRDKVLELLGCLNGKIQPDLVFITNGSVWLSDHLQEFHEMFPDAAIVDQRVYDSEEGWIRRYYQEPLELISRFIAVNPAIKEAFLEKVGLAEDFVDLIPHPIDSDRIERTLESVDRSSTRAKWELPEDAFVSVFIGRLVSQKQPLEYLKLASSRSENMDEVFLLIGDGELRDECLNFISDRNLENVRRIPFVDNIAELYVAADALVICSDYEALPLVFVEAICMGIPTLATNVGEIPATMNKYDAGLLADRNRPTESLIGRFDELKNDYSNLRQQIRAGSARNDFSVRNIGKLYESCWHKAIATKKAAEASGA